MTLQLSGLTVAECLFVHPPKNPSQGTFLGAKATWIHWAGRGSQVWLGQRRPLLGLTGRQGGRLGLYEWGSTSESQGRTSKQPGGEQAWMEMSLPHPIRKCTHPVWTFWVFLGFFFVCFVFFLAALGLPCCKQAFSSCSEWGLLFIAVSKFLTAVASLVVEHEL